MVPAPPEPWNPDRRWADPLIALLSTLVVLLASLALGGRQRSLARPAGSATLQGRLAEVSLAAPRLLPARPLGARDWQRVERGLKEPWDRALLALLAQELEAPEARPLLQAAPEGPGGEAFRRAVQAAYAGGELPDPEARRALHRRLGGGYGADLLEARLRDREQPGSGDALRASARAALLARLVGLGLLGTAVLAAAAGGLAVAVVLWVQRAQPRPPLPRWGLSGRAAALVGLTWFLGYFASGQLVAWILAPWPGLRWLALPLGYSLHAALGVWLIATAEGIPLRGLWQRVAPGRAGRDLAWGLAFLALAVLVVLGAALLTSVTLRPEQSPQRDLQELLRGVRGWGPALALFLTVAVLAPAFEELLFRGFLFPVLARRHAAWLALAGSSLLFGAIHLQPTALPVLGSLGVVLGLAMRQTGSLRTAVVVHGCWNGGLFLLMRALA